MPSPAWVAATRPLSESLVQASRQPMSARDSASSTTVRVRLGGG